LLLLLPRSKRGMKVYSDFAGIYKYEVGAFFQGIWWYSFFPHHCILSMYEDTASNMVFIT